MSKVLSNEEKGLLLELQADPRWSSILNKLARQTPSPYKPEGGDQFHKWVYESGQYRENRMILGILGAANE